MQITQEYRQTVHQNNDRQQTKDGKQEDNRAPFRNQLTAYHKTKDRRIKCKRACFTATTAKRLTEKTDKP